MRRGAWGIAWIVVALWTLLVLGIYVVFDLLGDTLIENADVMSDDPSTVSSVASLFDFLRDVGVGALAAIWAVVTLGILAIAAVGARFMARQQPRPPARR